MGRPAAHLCCNQRYPASARNQPFLCHSAASRLRSDGVRTGQPMVPRADRPPRRYQAGTAATDLENGVARAACERVFKPRLPESDRTDGGSPGHRRRSAFCWPCRRPFQSLCSTWSRQPSCCSDFRSFTVMECLSLSPRLQPCSASSSMRFLSDRALLHFPLPSRDCICSGYETTIGSSAGGNASSTVSTAVM